PVLIADEAHNILPFLTELNSVKVKYSEYPFPDDIEDPKVATKYVEDLAKAVQEEINRLNAFSTADNVGETGDFMSGRKLNSNDDFEELEEKLKRYSYLAKKLKENSGLFIIKMSDSYQGKELTIAPKNLRDASEALWPSDKVSKVILLSATFNEIDMKTLGIDPSEVMIIEVDSPIPPENRPFVF